MSFDFHIYGSTDPIYFKVTLSGAGVPSLVPFATDDIQLSKDGAAFADISGDVTEVGLGVYAYTPNPATDAQCEVMIINIKDVAGSAFDENCLIIQTGGNASARFNGT